MDRIKVTKLYLDSNTPTRKHNIDAGLDLYAFNNCIVYPNTFKILKTGVAVKIPVGYCGQVWPKGRSEYLIGAGIIDSGYTGEVLVRIINPLNYPMVIASGDPIAQLVIVKIETPEILLTNKNEFYSEVKTVRGSTGGIVEKFLEEDDHD